MIGFPSVACRSIIGLKSGDSIPNHTRNNPDMNPTGFTVSSATLSVVDNWPIDWKICRFNVIWHISISESVSVYGRYVVGLLSVWVRHCRSAVGYDSSIVLMIGFPSVACRLTIGLKSGDSIPNHTRNNPDMNPTGFTVSSATLSVVDSWPIDWKICRFNIIWHILISESVSVYGRYIVGL